MLNIRDTGRSKTNTSFDLVIRIISIFPILTSLINHSNIIKVLFVLLFFSCVLIWINNGIRRSTFIGLLVLLMHYVFVVLNSTYFPEAGLNLYIYYPFSIMFMMLIADYKEQFIISLLNNESYVRFMMKIWTAIVGISIFLPNCYYVKEGGTRFFGSFARSIFRLGPAALLIMSMVAISMEIYNRKRDILFSIIPMYCFFMGSSRTYLVVGVMVFIVLWYWYCQKRSYFLISVIPMSLLVLGIGFATAIGEKIMYTMDENQYGDFWFRLTSSRSEFWELDIVTWSKEPIVNRIFGSGFFFTHHVSGLWAHNDFIELLCSVGIFGMLFFLVYHFKMIKGCMNTHVKIPIVIIVACIMSWLFNAFFNMYYVYFCALLAFPMLLLAIRYRYLSEFQKLKILSTYKLKNVGDIKNKGK